MAHFHAAAIIPTLALGNLGTHLDELLEPYSEHSTVEPYFDTDTYDTIYELNRARTHLKNRAKNMTDLELLELRTGEHWSRNAEGTLGHWSTDNPNARWDWWEIGGRFHGKYSPNDLLTIQEARTTLTNLPEDEYLPRTIVGHDGTWYDRGRTGWFGFPDNNRDDTEWTKTFTHKLAEAPDTSVVVFIDFHI